jgi:hypothetical protein
VIFAEYHKNGKCKTVKFCIGRLTLQAEENSWWERTRQETTPTMYRFYFKFVNISSLNNGAMWRSEQFM